MQTELISECFLPFNFFRVLNASSLLSGLEINSPSKSITLSAPITKVSLILLLTLLAFNSAKFFEIISGLAFSLSKDNFTISSSTFEGSRSILIEIQSLVSAPSQSYGKRYSNGIEINRINMLIAILEKFSKITFNDKDIFVNVSKGVKVKDPSVDLAIIAALLSSFKDLTIPADNVFIGEVGLGGEVKTVTKIEKRIKEFERMGFKKCYISSQSIAQSKDLQRYSSNQMKLISIKNINELNQHIGEVE